MPLKRILEPEVMDTPEEARDYDAMDHSEVNERFVADLFAFLSRNEPVGANGANGGEILDLGTGTARIPIELCRRAEHYRVLAVDAAEAMLDVARVNIELAGLGERIMLDRADAKSLPYAAGRFAGVMSNSIIHHIPEPRAVFGEMVRAAAPGGWLFVRDLLRPASEAELRELVERYVAGENDHSRRMFAESLHAALALEEARQLAGEFGFGPETVEQTSDRHWTFAARKTAGPES